MMQVLCVSPIEIFGDIRSTITIDTICNQFISPGLLKRFSEKEDGNLTIAMYHPTILQLGRMWQKLVNKFRYLPSKMARMYSAAKLS